VRVTLRLTAGPSDEEHSLALRNAEGHEVPVQIHGMRQEGPYWYVDVGFLTRDVPALGYRVFWSEPGVRLAPNQADAARPADQPAAAEPPNRLAGDVTLAALDTFDKRRRSLIQASLWQVDQIAARYAGSGIPLDELIAVGYAGLVRAAELYNRAKGRSFADYAVGTI
jgi:hypothetical protein